MPSSEREVAIVPKREPNKEEKDALTKQKKNNLSQIETHLKKNIMSKIEDDHHFFSKLQDKKEHFKGLLHESFVPQNISDPEDKSFGAKTELTADCA